MERWEWRELHICNIQWHKVNCPIPKGKKERRIRKDETNQNKSQQGKDGTLWLHIQHLTLWQYHVGSNQLECPFIILFHVECMDSLLCWLCLVLIALIGTALMLPLSLLCLRSLPQQRFHLHNFMHGPPTIQLCYTLPGLISSWIPCNSKWDITRMVPGSAIGLKHTLPHLSYGYARAGAETRDVGCWSKTVRGLRFLGHLNEWKVFASGSVVLHPEVQWLVSSSKLRFLLSRYRAWSPFFFFILFIFLTTPLSSVALSANFKCSHNPFRDKLHIFFYNFLFYFLLTVNLAKSSDNSATAQMLCCLKISSAK